MTMTTTTEAVKIGSFTVQDVSYNVEFTGGVLQWTNDTDRRDVRLRDILSVEYTAETEPDHVTMNYVSQCGCVLKKFTVLFIGNKENCQSLHGILTQALETVSDRPRKLLVIINPKSGWGKGESVYKTKVEPVFDEAGISADVIVTKKSKHGAEIMETYDLKSVDGLVLMSGDGLYHEVTNGIATRMARDTGQDVNNTNYEPPEFPVPLAIIPCGTGNVIAKNAYKTDDIDTVIYSIVLGYKRKNCLFSVYSGEELVCFSSLTVSYGLWGDLMLVAEQRPWLGRWRYLASAVEVTLIRSQRVMDLSISYRSRPNIDTLNRTNLKKSPDETDAMNKPEHKTDEGSNSANEGEKPEEREIVEGRGTGGENTEKVVNPSSEIPWTNCFSGRFVGLMGICSNDFLAYAGVKLDPGFQGATDLTTIMGNHPCSRLQLMKFMQKLFTKPGEVLKADRGERKEATDERESLDDITKVILANEWKVELQSPNDPDSDLGKKERVLNVDGEHVTLKKPEFRVRTFAERIPLFCNPPYFTGDVKTE